MPKQKDLKRRVRARMKKTGESYTSARAVVVRKKENPKDFAEIAGVSDKALTEKTGCDWSRWVGVLDAVGAGSKPHKEIARYVHEKFDVSGWWAQTITVGYERIRGLREKGQTRAGSYSINKSKTFPVSIADLYSAFGARKRRRWLEGGEPSVAKAAREKSIRFVWDDDTRVDVYFWKKGLQKSQVQLQHRQLPDKQHADRLRVFWTERLAALGEMLKS